MKSYKILIPTLTILFVSLSLSACATGSIDEKLSLNDEQGTCAEIKRQMTFDQQSNTASSFVKARQDKKRMQQMYDVYGCGSQNEQTL